MGDDTSEVHTYRLSSLDQAAKREYLRYCLCFQCPANEDDIAGVTRGLTESVKRTVSQFPILAGEVREVTEEHDSKTDYLEVRVTLDKISNFNPTVKHLSSSEFPYRFADLTKARMPASAFNNESIMPFNDLPDPENAPVFAVQANFISGGVIVAIYLHHSVADVTGFASVLQNLSGDLPSLRLSNDDLRYDALEQSRLRDRLSGSRGIKAQPVAGTRALANAPPTDSTAKDLVLQSAQPISRILVFSLNFIGTVKGVANERFRLIHNDESIELSNFEIVAGLLWRAISRARFRSGVESEAEDYLQSQPGLVIPSNVRAMIEPGLDVPYLGNAELPALTTSPAMGLIMPFDTGTVAYTAQSIRGELLRLSDHGVRSLIANINESSTVQSSPTGAIDAETGLLITNLVDLNLEDAHLGLGCGKPRCIRRVGRTVIANECIVHPVCWREGTCEVTVQLEDAAMTALLGDEGFMAFVTRVV